MSSINQSGWRPTAPETGASAPATFTGNRALMLEEPLIFEIAGTGTTGVDIPPPAAPGNRLGGLAREAAIGRPVLRRVPAPEVHQVIERLVRAWLTARLDGEPLQRFFARHSDEELTAFAGGGEVPLISSPAESRDGV